MENHGFIIGSLLGVLVVGTISSIIRFSGTLNSAWMRIASGLLILGFIVMQRVITLGRDRRA
jgi:galactofuranose transport system permease protein